jgi:NAD(P)-dependent dehydrogenase (short-subunit alcohol dehydrogenase family)
MQVSRASREWRRSRRPGGVRVNVVSPGWVKETMVKFGMDPTPGKAAADVARAYIEAVEGSMNGETIEAK